MTDTETALKLLIFRIGSQLYGLSIANVVRIIELVTIIKLPNAPRGVKGIINFHGRPVPVIDMRHLLSLPPEPYTLRTPLILAHMTFDAGQIVALVVDTVENVTEVKHEDVDIYDDIVPTGLANGHTIDVTYLTGVTRIEQDLVLVLDVDTIYRGHEQLIGNLPPVNSDGPTPNP